MDHGQDSILIIDDNPTLLSSYQTFFEMSGFKVFIAQDGEQGLNLAETERPSIILLDLMLPGINGLQVLEHLKENPDLGAIPVIVITALVNDLKRQDSMNGGAVEYIEKLEVEPEDLLKKIKQLIRAHASKPS